MSAYSITLKPVYSQTVQTPEGITLPDGWALSWHQAETLEALRNSNIDVVFNTAMTGDGKSLAAYLRAMTSKTDTLSMYPTNELARDQERQVQDYKDKFQPKSDPQIYRLTGATLEDFVETNQLSSKQQGIINRIDNSELLLTNPDIFHYIHQFRYLRRDPKNPRRGDNADKCAIYDTTPDEPERDKFKTYGLPGLLSNFIFEVIQKDEFLAKVKKAGLPTKRFQEALCYLHLTDYREVRENWHFYHSGNLSDLARVGKVQILKGLEVTAGENAVSSAIYRRGIVCYISDRRRDELHAKLGLPMQFQAYGLSDRPDDRVPPYTIAFGQAALLLETLTWSWKAKEDTGWIC